MFSVSACNINSSHPLPAYSDAGDLPMCILEKHIKKIEESLENNTWMDLALSKSDQVMMPHLVALANKRKPGLNLKYVDSPYDLPGHIKSLSPNDYHSHKYIVRTGEDKVHMAMLDARFIDNKLSMILFEPASLSCRAPSFLALRIISAFEKNLPHERKPIILQMDIQRSNYECGIFSLALAKKALKCDECVLKLHHEIAKRETEIPSLEECKEIADKFLPVLFYKHTQGLKRMGEYLEKKPESIHQPLNHQRKKIMDHIKASYTEINGKLMSKSIHIKRLTEYKTLRDNVLNDTVISSDKIIITLPP